MKLKLFRSKKRIDDSKNVKRGDGWNAGWNTSWNERLEDNAIDEKPKKGLIQPAQSQPIDNPVKGTTQNSVVPNYAEDTIQNSVSQEVIQAKGESQLKDTIFPEEVNQLQGATQAEDITFPEEVNQLQGATQAEDITFPEEVSQLQEATQAEDITFLEEVSQLQGATQTEDITEAYEPQKVTNAGIGSQLQRGTQPKNRKYSNGTTTKKGFFKGLGILEPIVSCKDVKLTILLVENTEEVAKEKEKLEPIIQKLVATGKVCVVNYGSTVRVGKKVDASSFKFSDILCKNDMGEKACLFDALIALEDLVKGNYKQTEELRKTEYSINQIRIDSIDIIGIGRCIDNCSTVSSEEGIESFDKVVSRLDVVTKYFCLSEENFMGAATIGFHSIVAIARNYM